MFRQHRTTAAVALTLALTASLASTASADPARLAWAEAAIAAARSSAPVVRPNPDEQAAIAAARSGVPVGPNPRQQIVGSPSRATTHVTASNHAFDWIDAGIGAGATVILLGVGLAGTRLATSSREWRARQESEIAAG